MTLAELILPEYDQEMANTRKVLERVPNDRFDWKAHAKANSIGWVVSHLVEIPNWAEGTLQGDSWEIAPVGGEPYKTPVVTSREEALQKFDLNVATGRKQIAATSDEVFHQSWSLLMGGQPVITMPKLGVIRTWVLNHSIHHRAFLLSYLRLLEIPVPGMYGPSGDE